MILSCVTFVSCDSVMHEYNAQSGGIEYNIPAPLDSSSDFEIVIDAEMDFPLTIYLINVISRKCSIRAGYQYS